MRGHGEGNGGTRDSLGASSVEVDVAEGRRALSAVRRKAAKASISAVLVQGEFGGDKNARRKEEHKS